MITGGNLFRLPEKTCLNRGPTKVYKYTLKLFKNWMDFIKK